jgi:hypothetical protein
MIRPTALAVATILVVVVATAQTGTIVDVVDGDTVMVVPSPGG